MESKSTKKKLKTDKCDVIFYAVGHIFYGRSMWVHREKIIRVGISSCMVCASKCVRMADACA